MAVYPLATRLNGRKFNTVSDSDCYGRGQGDVRHTAACAYCKRGELGHGMGFSVYWDDYRKKNRHSLMFKELVI
jgi:hypothetical protein